MNRDLTRKNLESRFKLRSRFKNGEAGGLHGSRTGAHGGDAEWGNNYMNESKNDDVFFSPQASDL